METIRADTGLVEAIRRMLAQGRKRLVVIDETGRPAGLVDRETALRAVVRCPNLPYRCITDDPGPDATWGLAVTMISALVSSSGVICHAAPRPDRPA